MLFCSYMSNGSSEFDLHHCSSAFALVMAESTIPKRFDKAS